MTATVTDIRSPRHSWDKQPRKDDPTRHIRTCRRCGLRKRSEPAVGGWVELWLAEDGTSGEGKPPSCGDAQRQAGAEPVEAPTHPLDAAAVRTCARCNPPCGRPGKPYLGGISCAEVVAAAGAATREWIRGMRSSGGVA